MRNEMSKWARELPSTSDARVRARAMENHRKQGHDAMVHSTERYYSTSAL